jgi:hypothetical protein
VKAFISYSHNDAEVLTELHKHLAALRRQGLIETWTDREIDAGGVLDEEIAAAMEQAKLFLFLISASFINSDYCYEKEFKRALERHEKKEVIVVPIIIRECDWKIPDLKKFKALPQDGKPVISKYWHTQDEAFANVATGLRGLLEKRNKAQNKFVPDESHVTEEQRAELRKIHGEIVERVTVKASNLPDEEATKKAGKWFGIIWGQFHEEFGTKEHGLQSLPRDKFEAAKQWLLQYRASKDSNFKRTNPQKFRNTLTKTIYSLIHPLGWSKEQLYAFAAEKLGYAEAITSLNDLGNNQLELVRDRVRYELTKKNARSKQAKASKKPKPKFVQPALPVAKELLGLILEHPVAEERGLTEILRESVSALEMCFIPNTTARGSAPSVKKSVLRPAIAELVRLGWLLPPEEGHAVRIYELNPETQGNGR